MRTAGGGSRLGRPDPPVALSVLARRLGGERPRRRRQQGPSSAAVAAAALRQPRHQTQLRAHALLRGRPPCAGTRRTRGSTAAARLAARAQTQEGRGGSVRHRAAALARPGHGAPGGAVCPAAAAGAGEKLRGVGRVLGGGRGGRPARVVAGAAAPTRLLAAVRAARAAGQGEPDTRLQTDRRTVHMYCVDVVWIACYHV